MSAESLYPSRAEIGQTVFGRLVAKSTTGTSFEVRKCSLIIISNQNQALRRCVVQELSFVALRYAALRRFSWLW